jgi:exodeoxyribonuclease VII large subunit
MKPAGVGELQAAFEKLKQKLAAEGLFDEQFKKPIPEFPMKIGIATAIDGAAFQDMKSVASRRYPLAELLIVSCKVQGEGAAKEIAASIKTLNQQKDIDVIIVGRGGGSLEDLWAFNEEIVAKAIFESKIPIISAVGHEIDFTIADFVADLRAPTPSAAMELATPDRNDLITSLEEYLNFFQDKIDDMISTYFDEIDNAISSYGFRLPGDIIKSKMQLLDNTIYKFQNNLENKLLNKKNRLNLLESKIETHNIEGVLKRGFTIIKQNDRFVTRKSELSADQTFNVKFFDGEVKIK